MLLHDNVQPHVVHKIEMGGAQNILHTAQTYHHMMSLSLYH